MNIFILEDDSSRAKAFREKFKKHNLLIASNFEQAQNIFEKVKSFELVSLDHDLGKEKGGVDVARLMVEKEVKAKTIIIHSQNSVGANNIYNELKKQYKNIVKLPYSKKALDQINIKESEYNLKKNNKVLKEELQLIKFKYNGKNRTIKKPKVKLFDPYYKGRPEQKTYGQRNDLLGWSLSHVKNKKEAEKIIDDIMDFASMLSVDSKEAYKRIKYFYPKQAEFIRRYIRKHVKNLKSKEDNKWKKSDFSSLERFRSYND